MLYECCPVQREVEVLEPAELQRLVLAAIAPYVNRHILTRQIAREEEQRRALVDFLSGWGAGGRAHSREVSSQTLMPAR